MSINERISEIKEYFKEMQVRTVADKQIIYVIVNFPNGWVIDSSVEEKFNVTVLPLKNSNEYAFCCDIDDGENIVFDAISFCISKMKNAIERAKLLAEKTKELKEMFSDDNISIDTLRQLSFTFSCTDENQVNLLNEITKSNVIDEKNSENKKKEENEIKNNE